MQYTSTTIRSPVVNFFWLFCCLTRTVNWTVQLFSHLWVLKADVFGQNIETDLDSTWLAFRSVHPDVTGQNFNFG